MSNPLPDPFGYDYIDMSKDTKNQDKIDSFKENRMTVASRLLKKIDEKFPAGITSKVHRGIMNMCRGFLMDTFDIDIDKAAFHSVDKTTLNARSSEFRDPNKVYICRISQGINHCIAVIYKGKILGTAGSKLLNLIDQNSWKEVFKKADEIYWTKLPVSGEDGSLSFSRAQRFFMNQEKEKA